MQSYPQSHVSTKIWKHKMYLRLPWKNKYSAGIRTGCLEVEPYDHKTFVLPSFFGGEGGKNGPAYFVPTLETRR